jgi:hypothetical protein
VIRRALGLMLAAGVASCGSEPIEPPGPEAGVVVVSLNTPNDRDGALIIRIIGQHTNLEASGSYRLATANTAPGTTVRAILSGQVADGDILEFTIPDISKLNSYAVAVEQVAARDTYALLDPSGYNISLRVK